MTSTHTFISKLKHVEALIKQHDDSAARRYFNEHVLKVFDPDQLDEDTTILVYELDRYCNDAGMRILEAPVTECEYILESFDVSARKQAE